MKILIDETTGRCVGFGNQDNWPYVKPEGLYMTFENYNQWVCSDLNDIHNLSVWTLSDPPPSDPVSEKARDISFGSSLLLEFLAGQKDIALDNVTYRAMSEMFHFAEVALRRGDIPQAKTELTNIPVAPPVWTQDTKDYFISKINTYLGL